jgi:hypothetical protein
VKQRVRSGHGTGSRRVTEILELARLFACATARLSSSVPHFRARAGAVLRASATFDGTMAQWLHWLADMALDQATLDSLSRNIANEFDSRLEIVGIAATHGGSDRVELLVSVADDHDERRVHMLNLTRARRVDFESDLRRQLTERLSEDTFGS